MWSHRIQTLHGFFPDFDICQPSDSSPRHTTFLKAHDWLVSDWRVREGHPSLRAQANALSISWSQAALASPGFKLAIEIGHR